MNDVYIYLSGGMSGLSLENQKAWRDDFIQMIVKRSFTKAPQFFNPPNYYSPSIKEHKSEKEVMDFELYNIRKSDLVVVNFNVPKSIGTAMELMLAKELNIPIIGLNEHKVELHPWLIECCTRMCDSIDELVDHVAYFYLS